MVCFAMVCYGERRGDSLIRLLIWSRLEVMEWEGEALCVCVCVCSSFEAMGCLAACESREFHVRV